MRGLLFALAVAAATTAGAQNHNGGTFSVTWASGGTSYGVNTDQQGNFTTMSIGSSSHYQCEMYSDNRLVLVPDASSRSIWRIDPLTMAVVSTFVTSQGFGTGTPTGLDYDANGDLWMSTSNTLFRISPAGVVATAASFGGSHLGSDPLTGELVMLIGSTLFAVDRNTGARSTLGTGFSGRYGDLVRDPLSGDIYVPTCCGWSGQSLYVLPNGTSVASIYLADTGLAGAYGPQLDRVSAANRRIVTGSHVYLSRYPNSGGMWTIDLATGTPNKVSTFNAVTIADSTILESRSLHSTRTGPGQYAIGIDIPIDGGRSYVLGFSFSGPSPATPLSDGRRLPIVFDDLTRLTATNLSAPFITGTVGTLDASGRATAKVNLGPLTNALRKSAVWMCAVTFANQAPLGISIISDPKILKFD